MRRSTNKNTDMNYTYNRPEPIPPATLVALHKPSISNYGVWRCLCGWEQSSPNKFWEGSARFSEHQINAFRNAGYY